MDKKYTKLKESVEITLRILAEQIADKDGMPTLESEIAVSNLSEALDVCNNKTDRKLWQLR